MASVRKLGFLERYGPRRENLGFSRDMTSVGKIRVSVLGFPER